MSEAGSSTEQEVIRVGQIEIRYLHEAGSGRQMGCFEMRVPPGSNVPPPHSHSANEELVYALEGTLRYSVGDETRDLRPGDSMTTPRGVVSRRLPPASRSMRVTGACSWIFAPCRAAASARPTPNLPT